MVVTERAVTRESRSKRTLRVLQVFGGLGVGGAETWLLSLLRYFKESATDLPFDVSTTICLTSGVPDKLDGEAERLGAKLHYIRYGRNNLLPFARGFRRLLTENKFDAIHDHQDFSAGIHFLLGLGRLPPVQIVHVHNPRSEFIVHRTRTRRWAQAVGKRFLDRPGVFITGTSRQLLEEYGFNLDASDHNAARAVYCGFDVTPFRAGREESRASLREELGLPPDVPIILFVGRLGGEEILLGDQSHKNPRFAFRVFEHAVAKRPDLRLVFAGEKGRMHGVLAGIAKAKDLEDSVRFLGLRRDVPRLMLAADVLLFPSSAEGLGMVAVEAQAAGLPVLASDRVPAECVVVPELVRFLPLEADVAVWADNLLELIDRRPSDFSAYNAAVAASPFSIVTSASQLLEMYSRGLSRD